jgi:glucose/arabinose dehydrogenase
VPYAAQVQKAVSEATSTHGWSYAVGGVIAAFAGGLFVAQAGGSNREMFLSLGFLLGAIGLLGIVIGGVAIGIQLARD